MKQLENASARVHVSRLDSLKLQLQQQAEVLHGAQSEALNSSLKEVYERGYYHTAFELQKGIGVGWTLHGLTDSAIGKVLSRPWTLDGQTFSDRIWSNKERLVNTVNTQLTQMIMRGAAPDKAIKAISDRFRVSKSQAGRLVMTESAAFANEARKDCFKDIGVEKYVIVETLDNETCDLCGQLDGKVFPMSEYAVGVTAPPFHPWCRGCTAPYFDDMDDIGERYARGAEGNTYKVPKDMTYEEWKKSFVKGGQSAGGGKSQRPGMVTQIGIVNFSDRQTVLDELQKARSDFSGLDYEMNCTITADGKVWRVSGTSGQVNPWGIESCGSSLRGSYSYHNHPFAETWYSFSAEDVRYFFRSGAEYSEASDDLYRYVMQRTTKTLDIDPDDIYHEFKELRFTALEHGLNGMIDIDFDENHDIMQMLSEKYKFRYERRRLDGSQ